MASKPQALQNVEFNRQSDPRPDPCPMHRDSQPGRDCEAGQDGPCVFREEQRLVRESLEAIRKLADDLHEALVEECVEGNDVTACGAYGASVCAIAAIAEKTLGDLKAWK